MNIVHGLISDLREKRLWPIAVALVVALVAVPVLVSSGGKSSVPVAQASPPAPAGAVPALPAVSVTTTPSNAPITGKKRDPFTQQVKGKSTGAQTSSVSTSKTKASPGATKPSTGSTKTTSTTSQGAVGGSTTTVTSTPVTTTPPAKSAPAGLTDKQAYHVTVALSSGSGNVNTVDPVDRLSLFPSDQQPLLLELGVLNGGHRVLFAVQPGTVVHGPGQCTPGPVDCEIVSLAPNEIEWVGQSGTSGVTAVALIAVTGINAANYPSAAAADKARRVSSAAGRRLLNQSKLRALSLFEYRPSLGALVNLSNVTVGGS
ncbi:MAG TPA: hypothetical protein VG295_02325 [Solirubrobacteraceae bacterium]|jgi:hypothetical protein|nr:hypothetical protein [Solirubrobacteraceae bacterium]